MLDTQGVVESVGRDFKLGRRGRTDDDGRSLCYFSNLFIFLHDLLDPGLGMIGKRWGIRRDIEHAHSRKLGRDSFLALHLVNSKVEVMTKAKLDKVNKPKIQPEEFSRGRHESWRDLYITPSFWGLRPTALSFGSVKMRGSASCAW